MKTPLRWLPCLWLMGIVASGLGAEKTPQMYVPDGQLKSHIFRIFVTEEITSEMQPKLRFEKGHVFTTPNEKEQQLWEARVVPNQVWLEQVNGQTVQLQGTLLLFDLSSFPVAFPKPAVRLIPTLTWKDPAKKGGEDRMLMGGSAVYLADLRNAVVLTCFLIVLVVVMLAIWAAKKKKSAIWLICGPDGYMSLWRTQLAAWTIVVGAMVFCFGMIRLAVPNIPETLIALMGMSLLTGGVGAARARSAPEVKPEQVAEGDKKGPRLADLISAWDGRQVQLSLPKAQMVFWTILMLVLFVSKTLVEGELWDIPWQLVALTGFSQAGYIGDKFINTSPRPGDQAQTGSGGTSASTTGGTAQPIAAPAPAQTVTTGGPAAAPAGTSTTGTTGKP